MRVEQPARIRKIRKGDEVIVTTGKDKGRRGVVLSVDNKTSRVIVEGINIARKHMRATAQSEGGIKEIERPIHVSNVAIFNSNTGKADRVKFKFLDDGRKVRVFHSTKAQIDD